MDRLGDLAGDDERAETFLQEVLKGALCLPGPGWMRLWAYMAISHGSCGVNFFRWRCCRWGQEQHRDGILPHDGQSARRYEELVQMGDEIGIYLKHLS